jgi:hypothetical protein
MSATATTPTPTADSSALALARQSLQELVAAGVGEREAQTQLILELAVPAIKLAQEVARELHAYGLDDKGFEVADENNRLRIYWVREVTWNTGRRRQRQTHRASVLTVRTGQGEHIFWDPRTFDINWDLKCPPTLSCFKEFADIRLADADTLVLWADHALALLEKARERECSRTEFLRAGVNASVNALNSLNL